MSKTSGASSSPILTAEDLAECTNATSFAALLEAGKRASTLAAEKCVARGLTKESVHSAEALFKLGETMAEKTRGLQLLIQHLSSPRLEVVNRAIIVLKKSTRRANLNAASIGSALSEARKARVVSAQQKVS
jgi:hypothetical protein